MLNRSFAPFAMAIALLSAPSSAAQSADSAITALRAQDQRLAAIGERLQAANAFLCRETMPLTGMIFHSRDQYREDAAGMFTLGQVAVSSVVLGSPSEGTGVSRNDGLLAIEARTVAELDPVENAPQRDSVFEFLSGLPASAPLTLKLVGTDGPYTITIDPVPGCRALIEVRSKDEIGARSDGRVIQVNFGLAAIASDDQLAVTFAHELAHVVLEHRRRLSDAGVAKGFFGELGRNQRLNRQVEVEADRMMVHLLANAGYDPAIAAAFFRTPLGKRTGGGLFNSTIYPSPEARAELVEREIAEYLSGGEPSYPGHLIARRDIAF